MQRKAAQVGGVLTVVVQLHPVFAIARAGATALICHLVYQDGTAGKCGQYIHGARRWCGSVLENNFYNVPSGATALAGAVDTDQWLKNFAVYAVTLNNDSPLLNLNNWYIATMNGGENDWKIVQWVSL